MDPHETIYKYNIFSRGILGGLFVGILAAAVNLFFDYFYRKITHFQNSEFVNINSIIFFTIPTLVAAGIAYAILRQYVRKGLLWYTILALVLTAVVAFIPLGPNMLPNGDAMPASARNLTMGIEIITGLIAAFALPYFAEHQKIWSDDSLEQVKLP
jgi:cellobiose-specific phosphotransferase system component IIC